MNKYVTTFVDLIPESIEDGCLYISIKYKTVVHRCFCGCKQEVVTPISPIDWKINYDGKNVSLYPSVGNWNLQCRSHYWLKDGKVIWAEKWTQDKIRINRDLHNQVRLDYFQRKKSIVRSFIDKIFR